MSEFKCSKCGSENIQSYKVIYTGGQSNSFATTDSVSVGSDWSVGRANTEGKSISQLAQSCAPPKPKEEFGCFMYIFFWIISCFTAVIHPYVVIPAIIFSTWLLRSINKDIETFNANEFPKIYDDWEHSYHCNRCGHRFILK